MTGTADAADGEDQARAAGEAIAARLTGPTIRDESWDSTSQRRTTSPCRE
jgi:hypothetical protein